MLRMSHLLPLGPRVSPSLLENNRRAIECASASIVVVTLPAQLSAQPSLLNKLMSSLLAAASQAA